MKMRYLVWVFAIVFLYFYLSLFTNALIDDAFITMSYVETLSTSGTWGVYPGYMANTATSPLNVFFMTLINLIVDSPIKASIWVALIGFVVIAFALLRISEFLFETDIFGYLGAVAFAFNPIIISTIGIESILFVALFILSFYFYLTNKWNLLAIGLGLLTIVRPDGILFFSVFLIVIPTVQLKVRFISIYLLCIAPWYICSWVYLGSVIPDTFFIKTAAGDWQQSSYFSGIILYFQKYPFKIVLSFIFLPLMPAFVQKSVRNRSYLLFLFFLGVIHFVGYSVLNVPPFHWYYIPEITVIILFGILCLGFTFQKCPPNSLKRKIMQAIVAIYFFVPAIGMFQILQEDHFNMKEMPIQTNCATHEDYKEVGLWLKDNYYGQSIDLMGEVGTIAYYCDCYLLNEFSDRNYTKFFIDEYIRRSGMGSVFYEINFLNYEDNPDFPQMQYQLSMGNQIENNIQEWVTSTKWCQENYLTLTNHIE